MELQIAGCYWTSEKAEHCRRLVGCSSLSLRGEQFPRLTSLSFSSAQGDPDDKHLQEISVRSWSFMCFNNQNYFLGVVDHESFRWQISKSLAIQEGAPDYPKPYQPHHRSRRKACLEKTLHRKVKSAFFRHRTREGKQTRFLPNELLLLHRR